MTPGHVPTHLCLGGFIYNCTVLQHPEDSDSLSMTQLTFHPGARPVIVNSYGLGCIETMDTPQCHGSRSPQTRGFFYIADAAHIIIVIISTV